MRLSGQACAVGFGCRIKKEVVLWQKVFAGSKSKPRRT